MSTYFYAICDVHKLVCGCSTSHGTPLVAHDAMLHPFIARHVYCKSSLGAPRRPCEDFASSIRIVDEHSWEKEQAVCELNGWRHVTEQDLLDDEDEEPIPDSSEGCDT